MAFSFSFSFSSEQERLLAIADEWLHELHDRAQAAASILAAASTLANGVSSWEMVAQSSTQAGVGLGTTEAGVKQSRHAEVATLADPVVVQAGIV